MSNRPSYIDDNLSLYDLLFSIIITIFHIMYSSINCPKFERKRKLLNFHEKKKKRYERKRKENFFCNNQEMLLNHQFQPSDLHPLQFLRKFPIVSGDRPDYEVNHRKYIQFRLQYYNKKFSIG